MALKRTLSSSIVPDSESLKTDSSITNQNSESNDLLLLYNNLSETTRKKIQEINTKIKKVETASTKDIQDIKKNVLKTIDDKQIKSMEALGIFVALFSYVSVSIQIFSRISDLWSAGIFVALIFCALTIMIILFDMLLVHPAFKLYCDYRLWLIIIFIITGFSLIFSLRRFPINPIPGTVEFDTETEARLDRIIKSRINESDNIRVDILKSCIKHNDIKRCLTHV